MPGNRIDSTKRFHQDRTDWEGKNTTEILYQEGMFIDEAPPHRNHGEGRVETSKGKPHSYDVGVVISTTTAPIDMGEIESSGNLTCVLLYYCVLLLFPRPSPDDLVLLSKRQY